MLRHYSRTIGRTTLPVTRCERWARNSGCDTGCPVPTAHRPIGKHERFIQLLQTEWANTVVTGRTKSTCLHSLMVLTIIITTAHMAASTESSQSRAC